jgi:hypothetical protein
MENRHGIEFVASLGQSTESIAQGWHEKNAATQTRREHDAGRDRCARSTRTFAASFLMPDGRASGVDLVYQRTLRADELTRSDGRVSP